MTSIAAGIIADAPPSAVWNTVRNIGALRRCRLPGLVVATAHLPGGRCVPFGTAIAAVEPFVSLNHDFRLLVWTADVLPDEAAASIRPMMR